jgi:hypothetical protein
VAVASGGGAGALSASDKVALGLGIGIGLPALLVGSLIAFYLARNSMNTPPPQPMNQVPGQPGTRLLVQPVRPQANQLANPRLNARNQSP